MTVMTTMIVLETSNVELTIVQLTSHQIQTVVMILLRVSKSPQIRDDTQVEPRPEITKYVILEFPNLGNSKQNPGSRTSRV